MNGIEDYAIIGNCRSAALVSREGSIDWLCWPRFDSPSLFAAVLDPHRGGHFRVGPTQPSRVERRYRGATPILETRFHTATGALALTDLMSVQPPNEPNLSPENEILRRAECLGGEVELEVVFDPRPDFGRPGSWELRDRGRMGVRLSAHHAELILRSGAPLQPRGAGGFGTRLRLRTGECVDLSLSMSQEAPAVLPPLGDFTLQTIEVTRAVWEEWFKECRYDGPERDAVARSALTLKLLAYGPSGAIVAAPTTSLPERPGGSLNWDYRYCWLRDAALTVRALFGLGFSGEARGFVSWLLHTTRLTRPALKVFYDLYGRLPPPEEDLTHLAGYGGARPVRVGNGARDQLQLDLYGDVVDAAAQLAQRKGALDRETERALVGFGRYVCDHWREPDEGIWEPRIGRREHVHSWAMCWVALDRLLRLHLMGHLKRAPIARFRHERAAIRQAIERLGWNDQLQSYVATPGSEKLDATLLQLALYRFEDPLSVRARRTYERIRERLGAGDALLYRNHNRDLTGEGAFALCSFWAVQYLAEGGGSLEEANALFAQMLRYRNDVGLYAEEIDPATGRALGNFPQAFTHIGLINAALALGDRARQERATPRHRRPPATPAEARP